MGLILADRFCTFAPRATPGTREALEAAATAKGFSGLILAHWLGQMFVESKGFTTREESLNYSVQGLLDTFGRHRISKADAEKFGRIDKVVKGRKTVVRAAHQNAIANIVYGGEWGRKNLGNTQPGDGWKFRFGSSAFTRHSITWPRSAGSSRTPSGSPAATRICSFTRSTPVIISVTGCSTWMRVFISMK